MDIYTFACLFRYLVSHGCDVNNHCTEIHVGTDGDTALHVACEEGALDLVRLMMEHGGKKLLRNGLTDFCLYN